MLYGIDMVEYKFPRLTLRIEGHSTEVEILSGCIGMLTR